jgi:MFS transporter, DHA3 family, macrolide efflux protein
MSTTTTTKPATSRHMLTFYTLILTQTFSLIGSRISGLAIGIWVFHETGNATPLALVSFFAVIPMVLASGLSGLMADRWDRRYIMALADVGQAIGTLLLFASFLTDSFQLWHLYSVTFINSIFGAFQKPAFQASVTMLISDEHRDRANAIQQLTGPAAGIIAPIIAGFTFAFIGVEGSIILDLVTFLVAMVVLLSVSIPRPEQTDKGRALQGSLWQESLGGLHYLWSRRTLFIIMLFTAVVNFLIVGVMVLLTPYILTRTGSEVALGIILSLFNLGAITGGVIIGVWGGTRPRVHTMMPGLIIAGIFLMLMGMAQSTLLLAVTAFLFMLPMPMINAPFMSMMQAKVPPDIQGRVFAVNGQISMLLTPIAYLLMGPLADDLFEPAVSHARWEFVAPFVGDGVGSGMGLIIVLAGGLATLLTIMMYTFPAVGRLEANLPDYIPVQQIQDGPPEPDDDVPSSVMPAPVAR